jgi:hypothetical protein
MEKGITQNRRGNEQEFPSRLLLRISVSLRGTQLPFQSTYSLFPIPYSLQFPARNERRLREGTGVQLITCRRGNYPPSAAMRCCTRVMVSA